MVSQFAAEFAQISDDVTIRYLSAGSGHQVILLVPGWTMTCEVFERQLEHFEGSAVYRCIAIDPRSQGLSTHTSEGNFYEQHGRDLHAFMDKLGLENVVLGGWSNGGFDILAYVNQFGAGSLKGLIMLDAAPKGSGLDKAKDWAWFLRDDSDGYRQHITMSVLKDRERFDEEFARWMVADASPEYLRWITGISRQTGNGVAALLNESSAYQDYSSDLKALEGTIALLYFVNADWESTVESWAAQNTPSATVVAMGKHLAFWERAAAFNEVLDRFLVSMKS